MKLLDLSHEISEETIVYPNTPQPKLINAMTFEEHGYREKMLSIGSHTSTHIDAPAHILKDGLTLDKLPLAAFYGRATVVDVSGRIGSDGFDFQNWVQLKNLGKIDFLLFHTGWDMKWNSSAYVASFPFLSIRLAQEIVQQGFRGVGIDTISIDAINSEELPAHNILLASNILIMENLCRLEPLIGTVFDLAAFPLKIRDGDGCPVRAVAFIE
jgi:kynurenine formamidase